MMHGMPRVGRIRKWMIVGAACVLMHLAVPRDAFALLEWLDHLSGPGPFRGEEYYARLFCVMDRPSPELARKLMDDLEQVRTALTLPAEINSPFELYRKNPKVMSTSVLPMREQLLTASAAAQNFGQLLRSRSVPQLPELQRQQLLAMTREVEDITRQASVPRVSAIPGLIAWADCRDRPRRRAQSDTSTGLPLVSDTRGDRHPIFSLGLHYRRYTTGTVRPPELLGLVALRSQSRSEWANGQDVTLKTFTLQGSWPLTGRLDILDGSAAIGVYRFRSDDFSAFHGVIVEPVRVDLHVPARVFDNTNNPLLKIAYSMSLRWGFMTFPGGIEASRFNASGSAVGKDVSDVIFDWGIGWNVGRLFGL
jgi:hypothetical protein